MVPDEPPQHPYSSSISLHKKPPVTQTDNLQPPHLLHSYSSYTQRISIYSSTQLYCKVDVNSRSPQYLSIYIYQVDYKYGSLTRSLLYVITRATPRIPYQYSLSLPTCLTSSPPFFSALTSDIQRPRSPVLPVKKYPKRDR